MTACECSQCHGHHWVRPSERRAHLKEDRGRASADQPALVAGTGAVVAAPHSPEPSANVADAPIEVSQDWSPPLFFPDSPILTPEATIALSTASPLGTPHSSRKEARIRHAEWSAMQLEVELLLGQDIEAETNDNWEDEVGGDVEDILDDSGNEGGQQDSGGQGYEARQRTPNDGTGAETSAGSPSDAQGRHGARDIPQHKKDENSPDPFAAGHTKTQPPPPQHQVHPDGGVYILYILVTWLHSQFHLPFRACNAILVVFGLILQSFGITTSMPVLATLPSVMERLGVEPTFRVLPVCPQCLEVYPEDPATGPKCTVCGTDLFKTGRTRGGKDRASKAPVPDLRFPYKSIAAQLAEIVALPGMEDELDGWRRLPRKSRHYSDFFDGSIARDLKGHDDQPFFANGELDLDGPDGELRIGLTLGADW